MKTYGNSTVKKKMKSPNKLSSDQLSFITSVPAYITKSERQLFNKTKNELLDEIKKTFGCSWFRMKEGTQKAFEFVCFLSVDRGYFYASAGKTASKHGISEKTIYRLLKNLVDEGVLTKKNFESSKHNGLGNAVYFFKSHPYFHRYAEKLEFDHDENYNENNDEKTEVAEKPCPESDSSENIPSTYSLPSDLPKEFKDLHLNVTHMRFSRFVPKVINQMFYQKLGGKLRTIWIKLNQAFKYIKHPMLSKDSLYIIAKQLCFQLTKNKKRVSTMNEDQLAAYSYKSALNMFYEMISNYYLADIELKSPEIDLEYDFSANETYVLLPPHKHTEMHDGYERESVKGNISDLELSIYCNEVVYTLENHFTKINTDIGFSELREQVLNCVTIEQDDSVVSYIKHNYDDLTFNKHRLDQEQESILNEYKELAKKLDSSSRVYECTSSELPF